MSPACCAVRVCVCTSRRHPVWPQSCATVFVLVRWRKPAGTDDRAGLHLKTIPVEDRPSKLQKDAGRGCASERRPQQTGVKGSHLDERETAKCAVAMKEMAGNFQLFYFSPNLGRNSTDAVLTVVDKATINIDILPCRKDVTETGDADFISQNIVKLHGIPITVCSNRETQFTLQFWGEFWTFQRE